MGAAREPVPGLRLGHAVADFLADLTHANRAAATIRAYRTDLASFTAYYRGPPESITPDVRAATSPPSPTWPRPPGPATRPPWRRCCAGRIARG